MFEIRCPLREAAYVSKHQTGLRSPEGALTFYEYDQLVTVAAERLRDLGVAPGERVGLAVDLGWRQPVLMLAIIRAGGVACLLNTRAGPVQMAARLQEVSCRRALVSDPAAWTDRTTGLQLHDAQSVAALGAMGCEGAFADGIPADRPVTILFAGHSGTRPRAILHAYENHYYSALGCNANVSLRSRDRYLLAPAIHDVEGLAIVFRCLVSGATLVAPDPAEPFAGAVAQHGITHASATMEELESFLDSPAAAESALKCVMVGESVCAAALKRASDARIRIHSYYGLPEMASQVTAVSAGETPEKQATRGRALKYRELEIGPAGEIRVKGHPLMVGYVTGDRTERPVSADGWFSPGEKGRLDGEGHLVVPG